MALRYWAIRGDVAHFTSAVYMYGNAALAQARTRGDRPCIP